MNYYHLSKYIRLAKKIKVEWYLRTTLLRLVENNNAIWSKILDRIIT